MRVRATPVAIVNAAASPRCGAMPEAWPSAAAVASSARDDASGCRTRFRPWGGNGAPRGSFLRPGLLPDPRLPDARVPVGLRALRPRQAQHVRVAQGLLAPRRRPD